MTCTVFSFSASVRSEGKANVGQHDSVRSARLSEACDPWPAWVNFKDSYVDISGRVIDYSSDRRITVSEGQAYALFFALVARDRVNFDRLLRWTEDNLAAGSLKERLPAWRWGRRDDGSWGVIDANSATDADIWMSYTLAQAHRVWRSQRYLEISTSLSSRILREATAHVPGVGLVLLPAPQGFGPHVVDGVVQVRLNPSYLPPSILKWLARNSDDRRWREIYESSIRILEQSASKGFAPDWVTVFGSAVDHRAEIGGARSGANDRFGSYDAIRVYLWLGLMPENDSMQARLLPRFGGMARSLNRTADIPEKIDISTGDVIESNNFNLGWALLPYLKALGRAQEFSALEARMNSLQNRFPAYFEDALMLFSSAHLRRRFRFEADGSLELARNSCSNVSSPLSRR